MNRKFFLLFLIGCALLMSACDTTPKNEVGKFNSSHFNNSTFK
jgi:starvation-inducible outer membrane lipoprotein